MEYYYRCLNCSKIPSIEILKDHILIKCLCKNKDEKINIEDFHDKYIGNYDPEKDSNLLNDKNFFCKSHKNNYYNSYCQTCKKDICQDCSCHKSSHNIVPDKIMKENNNNIKQFLSNALKYIKDLEKEVNKKKCQIISYYSLLINDNKKYINKQLLLNFENLDIENIIKNKNIFIDKINQMILELKKFDYFFEYNDNDNNNENYNKKTQEEHFKNSNEAINVNNMTNKDLNKLYIIPKEGLYERYSIKLENIIDRSFDINDKISKLWVEIDEKNDNLKHNFLQLVGNIARKSHIFSRKLLDILIKDLKELNPYKSWNTIIYENAKIKLSSLFEQCLIIDKSDKKLRDTRIFFEYHCKKEIDTIFDEIISNNNEIENIYLNKKNDYINLFISLSQLYTEVLLYAEKKIILRYIDESHFDSYTMKDITEVPKPKKVKYTILPGLFVKDSTLTFGRILVVCESKNKDDNKNIYKLKFDNPSSDFNSFQIDNTIKIDDISKEISCEILNNKNIEFTIETTPKIPKDDHAAYFLKINESQKEYSSYNNVFNFTEPLDLKCYRGYVIIKDKKIESPKYNINS